jgi:hypothetical protein
MSHDASDRGERIASLLRERGNAETEKLPFSRYLDRYRNGKTRKGKVTGTLGVNVSLGRTQLAQGWVTLSVGTVVVQHHRHQLHKPGRAGQALGVALQGTANMNNR